MADQQMQRSLLRIYLAAIAEVDGRACVRTALGHRTETGDVALVAIGKAAQAMALGAVDALGERVRAGLVVSKRGHLDFLQLARVGLQGVEGGHPVPDAQSLAAGRTLLEFLAQQPPDRTLLFLISGGTSSLVEVLREGIGLEGLQRANRWLLGSGLPIHEVNLVRKGLSAIKAGGLLGFVGGRPVEALLISDVPGDDPAVIGSGLLAPDPQACEETASLELPSWLRMLIGRCESPLAPAAQVRHRIVANLDQALQAAETAARAEGFPVLRHAALLQGDAAETGRQLGRFLCQAPPGLHVWGGETTVRLPERPGRGGRNQHLALSAAVAIQGRADCLLLAAGSDGTDGPTDDAGALVDGRTVARGASEGCEPMDCLRRADAGRFLAASGDLLNTGPTGTNVMDLVLGLRLD